MEVARRKLHELRYSPRTEEAYVYWIRQYILHHGRRHPRDMGEAEVKAFLSALAVEKRVAASTQNQALAALTFLYERVLNQPLTRIDGIEAARRRPCRPFSVETKSARSSSGSTIQRGCAQR